MKKRLAFAVLMATSVTAAWGADKPNPADYTMTMHVVGATVDGQIVASVDGECLRLAHNTEGMLILGDYPARDTKFQGAPLHHPKYDRLVAYELLLPDGKSRIYNVTASGTAVLGGCPPPTR